MCLQHLHLTDFERQLLFVVTTTKNVPNQLEGCLCRIASKVQLTDCGPLVIRSYGVWISCKREMVLGALSVFVLKSAVMIICNKRTE